MPSSKSKKAFQIHTQAALEISPIDQTADLCPVSAWSVNHYISNNFLNLVIKPSPTTHICAGYWLCTYYACKTTVFLNGKYSNTTYIYKNVTRVKNSQFSTNTPQPQIKQNNSRSSDKKTSSGNTAGSPALKGTTSRICTFDLNNPGQSKVTIKTSCVDHNSHWQVTMNSMFGPIAAELSALSPAYKLMP